MFKARAFRTSKQASPDRTVLTGERADRRKPGPADLVAAATGQGVWSMPTNRFDQLYDPVSRKIVQRDGDVQFAIASEAIAHVHQSKHLQKCRAAIFTSDSCDVSVDPEPKTKWAAARANGGASGTFFTLMQFFFSLSVFMAVPP